MTNSLDRNAILGILVRREHAAHEVRREIKLKEAAEKREAIARDMAAKCDAALLVFGIDVNDDAVFKGLVEEYGADVIKLVPPSSDETGSTEGAQPQVSLPAPPQAQKISDLVLKKLEEVGSAGSKAAPIRDWIKKTYNIEIHDKTVGMTLYRLLKKQRVRRDRHTWFFVSEAKNPGGDSPGSVQQISQQKGAKTAAGSG